MHLKVVERITEQIRLAAQGSSPHEAGGLLLGTVEFDAALRKSIIDCRAMPCGHQSGSSYHLSDGDLPILRDEISRWKAERGSFWQVLGFYRSHNRPGFSLDEEDLALAREFPSDHDHVFLLVQPALPSSVGCLFFIQKGLIQDGSRILFPFDTRSLLAGQTSLPDFPADRESPQGWQFSLMAYEERRPPEIPEAAAAPATTVQPGLQADARGHRRTSRWRILGSTALVIVLAGAAYLYVDRAVLPGGGPEVKKAEGVGLKARMEDGLLRVTWDSSSPAIAAAKGGILTLSDGNISRDLTVTASELREGSITLPSVGRRVAVQLRLIVDAGSTEFVEDLARADLPNPISAATPAVDPLLTNRSPRVARQPPRGDAIRGSVGGSAPPRPLPAAAASPPPMPAATGGQVRSELTRPFPMPQIAAAAAPKDDASSRAPAGAAGPPAPVPPPKAAHAPVTPVEETAPDLRLAEAPPAPAPPAESPEVSRPAPAFAPAALVSAIEPIVIPSSIKTPGVERAQVSVQLYIDKEGAVIGAKSLATKGILSDLAIEAARRLRFLPARRDGQAVASELVLEFKLVRNEPR